MSAAAGDEHWMRRSTLTVSELAVMKAFAEHGEHNAQIAKRLLIEPATVKFHMTRIMRKADVTNRTQLVLWWIRSGRYDESHGQRRSKRQRQEA